MNNGNNQTTNSRRTNLRIVHHVRAGGWGMNAELSREIMSLQFFGLKNRINKQINSIGDRFIPPRYAYLSVLGGCWIKVGQTYSGKRFVVKDDDSVFMSFTSSSSMVGTVTFTDTVRIDCK